MGLTLFWLEHQAMYGGIFDCSLRKWQGEGVAVVPSLPLVHVIRTEKSSRFAGQEIQSGCVEIGKICSKSFGGAVIAAQCINRVTTARLGLFARSGPVANDGDFSEHQILNRERILWSPLP